MERRALLELPSVCLDPAIPAREAAIGEALFNAPALLGGQAERGALSCAGCHANGRRSAWFFLAGISAAPGTADVSSSFFALPRANATFDPKPIPDLALPGKVSREVGSGALEAFLRGLVVEEFSGDEPSPAALAALAAYIRALKPCRNGDSEAKTQSSDLRLVNVSIDAALSMIERGEHPTARVLVKAARFRLGLIHERMAGTQLAAVRRRLIEDSRALAPFETATDATGLAAWHTRFERRTVPLLLRQERLSLYNPREVDRWLAPQH